MFDNIDTEDNRELRQKNFETLKSAPASDIKEAFSDGSKVKLDSIGESLSQSDFAKIDKINTAVFKASEDISWQREKKQESTEKKKTRYPEPLQNKVAVLQSKTAEKIGSILVPDTAQKKENTGVVVAIGPDVKSPKIVKGALVQFGEYCGVESTIDGIEYFIMSEKDILAIIPTAD